MAQAGDQCLIGYTAEPGRRAAKLEPIVRFGWISATRRTVLLHHRASLVRQWHRSHQGKDRDIMDVFEAIRTILAVRSYQDQPVPEELVHRIVEAGRLTASSINLQPWHFVVVPDKATLRQLGSLAKTGPYIGQAALAVVVAVEKDSRFAVSDASRAIQDMMLTAWAEGVGSNWVGFSGLEAVGDLLGVPADMDVLAIIPFGYPAKAVGRGKKNRKRLAEVASRERYEQPFV